jgi:hypothetical protein
MTDESAFASDEVGESAVEGSLRGGSKGLSGLSSFVETKQYRLFTEFCETCQVYRYIGVCYGEAGVGKTLSARRLTRLRSDGAKAGWGCREASAWCP